MKMPMICKYLVVFICFFGMIAFLFWSIERTRGGPVNRSEEYPVVGSIKAIDSAATINDQSWFDARHKEGFRLYVMHSTAWGTCNTWEHTERQLGMALASGMAIAVYTRDPRCWKGGIEAAGIYKDKLSFFALDVEIDPGIAVTRDMINGVRHMGITPVIYTSSSMWHRVQGIDQEFSDIALWDSDVRGDAYVPAKAADLYHPTPIQYSGWNEAETMRVGVQQYFDVTIDGVLIDVNSFNPSILRLGN